MMGARGLRRILGFATRPDDVACTVKRSSKLAILTRLEALKDLAQEAIDKGATTVEQIHQAIAAMPLEALEKRGLLDEEVASLKEKQAATIGAVYDAIRRVNKEIGDLASGLIESLEDHADAQRNISRKD